MRAAEELDFTDPLLWVNDPAAAALLTRTGWRTLYDVTDDWRQAGLTGAEHARVVADETLLLRDAAHVVVCSPALLAAKGADRQGRPLSLVPNAVDVDGYRDPGPRPQDLPSGSVVLYVGTIHPDRVDLALCARTARRLGTRATVVLVGPAPIDPAERRTARGGRRRAPRARATPPPYPHTSPTPTSCWSRTWSRRSPTAWTPSSCTSTAPRTGPVVSTPVAGFREADDPRVTLAVAEDFPTAVVRRPRASIRPPRLPGEMSQFQTPSWGVRAATMRSVLDDVAAEGDSLAPHRRHRARLPHPARRRRTRRPRDAPGLPGRDDLHDALRPGPHVSRVSATRGSSRPP